MASQAHGEPITGSSLTANPFSTKKKKKIQSQKLNPINPSRRWRLASRRVVAGWQRDQTPIQKQTKHRTQQTKHRAQRCLSKKKKKKKKSPIHKPKSNPVNHLPTDGHVAAVSSSSLARSPLIADRRLENADRSASAPVLPPALPQGISLFFSLTLSQALTLYLTEIKKEMNCSIADRHRRL